MVKRSLNTLGRKTTVQDPPIYGGSQGALPISGDLTSALRSPASVQGVVDYYRIFKEKALYIGKFL
jgi:hypothetical protein